MNVAGRLRSWAPDLRGAVVPWVVARGLVIGSLVLSRRVFDEVPQGRRPVTLGQGLFAWDGAYYRAIAEHGYSGLGRAALRFFPLFALTGRYLGAVLFGHGALALLVVANLSALGFGTLMHRLARRETGGVAVARRAAWFAALFPAAVVLVMGYADATALVLVTGCFLALRSERFATAGALGFLAALTRPLGVLLVVPALVEVWRTRHDVDAPGWVRRAAAVVGPGLGLAVYGAWVQHTRGDAWLPFSVQQRPSLRGRFVDPVTRLVRAAEDLVHGDRFGSGLHLVWALVFLALLVVVARRLPASYTWFSAATLLVALSADNLDSLERYALGAFPLLLALALVTRRPQVERAVLVASGAGLVAYAVLAFAGVTVP
ncbi:MAG: hypothetical protein WCI50_11900 [Actinomycetes bacterium]